VNIKFGVSSAWLVGVCKECGQPTTGEINTDAYQLDMRCVNCNTLHQYDIKKRGYSYSTNIKKRVLVVKNSKEQRWCKLE
jgi:hypothetical protein